MADREQFFSKDMTRITGVKLNRLQPWMERGFVTPSIEQAAGSGTRNIFSRFDLYRIRIFRDVVEMGLPRKLVCAFLGLLPNENTVMNLRPSSKGPLFAVWCRRFVEMKVVGDGPAVGTIDGVIIKDFSRTEKPSEKWNSYLVSWNDGKLDLPFDVPDQVFMVNLTKIMDEVDVKV